MKMERVMLIDGDSISNTISKNAITKFDVTNQIIIKSTGKEALEYLRTECTSLDKFPDLILVDLKLPDMNGFEFMDEYEQLCQNVRKYIVIVFLTKTLVADDIVKLRRLAKFFLVYKPLTEDLLSDIYLRFFRYDEDTSRPQLKKYIGGLL